MNIILAKKLGDTFSLGAFRRFLSFFQCGLQLLAQICELRGSREQAVGERAELVKLLETCTAVYEVSGAPIHYRSCNWIESHIVF